MSSAQAVARKASAPVRSALTVVSEPWANSAKYSVAEREMKLATANCGWYEASPIQPGWSSPIAARKFSLSQQWVVATKALPSAASEPNPMKMLRRIGGR